MDRFTRQQVEERVVTISEVDLTNHRVILTDQYQTTLYASLHLSGPIFVVPKVGEIWTVKRSGSEWFLTKKRLDVSALTPGDALIDASGITSVPNLKTDKLYLGDLAIWYDGTDVLVQIGNDITTINFDSLGGITVETPEADTNVHFDIKLFSDIETVVTGDNKMILIVTPDLVGKRLIRAEGFITTLSSSGLVNVQVRHVDSNTNMLLTPITIDVGEYTSYTGATPSVIGSTVLALGNRIAIDIDGSGTGAKGLGVALDFGV